MPATPKIVPADPKLWRQGFLTLSPGIRRVTSLSVPIWMKPVGHSICTE